MIKDYPLWEIKWRNERMENKQKAKDKSDSKKSQAMVAAWSSNSKESDSEIDETLFMAIFDFDLEEKKRGNQI